jgi:REP element-mobilizing transposase RayT
MGRQREMVFRTWGGKRKGAGRKPKVPGKRGSPHRRRPDFDGRHPVHVTLKAVHTLPNLRRRRVWSAAVYALAITARRTDMRICHISIQRDHIHLIVEADNKVALARGLQGFQISCAKQINSRLGRSGRVFADRYHMRVLTNPTMVRNAIRYVLNNARHHEERFAGLFDPCSSARQFAGWIEAPRFVTGPFFLVAHPKTYLLRESWKRLAPLSAREVPG